MITSAVDSLYAFASTPDENVTARLEGRTEVTVRMAPGYFRSASAADLEWQLGRLAKLLFVARMREYYKARSIDFGTTVQAEGPPVTDADHTYVEARATLVAEGGTGSVVEIVCVGMEQWTVRVDPEQLGRVDEEDFCGATARAASELIADQLAKARALKIEVYVR